MKNYPSNIQTFSFLHQLHEFEHPNPYDNSRLIIKNGRIVDPKNGIDGQMDIGIEAGTITEVAQSIEIRPEDRVINSHDLVVFPGLIDVHLHLGDLLDIYESPLFKAAKDGITLGLSPGAGNTFMTPALLGAEVDRGIPIHAGVYLGAASILGTSLKLNELIALFQNNLSQSIMAQKLSRNGITNATAHLVVGIKDHMGHFIMTDENINLVFEITSKAGLIYMSHTQDPKHAQRMVTESRGRPLHLAHATAAGCGTHGDPVKAFQEVLSLIDNEQITAEFVSSMLLPNQGRRDGLKIDTQAQQLAFQALHDGKVELIVSDGQSGSTMKGFGDTSDNLPCIFFLAEQGVLSLSDAVATMTCNSARFLSKRLNNQFFASQLGHLGIGAYANLTIADPLSQKAVYTIVNGGITAFDGNLVPEGFGAGCLISKYGLVQRTGIGDLSLYSQVPKHP